MVAQKQEVEMSCLLTVAAKSHPLEVEDKNHEDDQDSVAILLESLLKQEQEKQQQIKQDEELAWRMQQEMEVEEVAYQYQVLLKQKEKESGEKQSSSVPELRTITKNAPPTNQNNNSSSCIANNDCNPPGVIDTFSIRKRSTPRNILFHPSQTTHHPLQNTPQKQKQQKHKQSTTISQAKPFPDRDNNKKIVNNDIKEDKVVAERQTNNENDKNQNCLAKALIGLFGINEEEGSNSDNNIPKEIIIPVQFSGGAENKTAPPTETMIKNTHKNTTPAAAVVTPPSPTNSVLSLPPPPPPLTAPPPTLSWPPLLSPIATQQPLEQLRPSSRKTYSDPSSSPQRNEDQKREDVDDDDIENDNTHNYKKVQSDKREERLQDEDLALQKDDNTILLKLKNEVQRLRTENEKLLRKTKETEEEEAEVEVKNTSVCVQVPQQQEDQQKQQQLVASAAFFPTAGNNLYGNRVEAAEVSEEEEKEASFLSVSSAATSSIITGRSGMTSTLFKSSQYREEIRLNASQILLLAEESERNNKYGI